MIAAGVVAAGVLIAPLASKYIANRPILGDRDPGTVALFSATPQDYLKPHFRSYAYGKA